MDEKLDKEKVQLSKKRPPMNVVKCKSCDCNVFEKEGEFYKMKVCSPCFSRNYTRNFPT